MLTHHARALSALPCPAYRHILDRLLKGVARLKTERDVEDFCALWARSAVPVALFRPLTRSLARRFELSHAAHARFEDNVLFPEFDKIFPGASQEARQQHEAGHGDAAALSVLLDTLCPRARVRVLQLARAPAAMTAAAVSEVVTMPTAAQLAEMRARLEAISAHENAHMDYEERHLQPIGQKYFNAKVPATWRSHDALL